MNAEQKKFIRKKLIPFVLREQGRGFGMSQWLSEHLVPGVFTSLDSIERKVPVCGTVACIGGSIDVLMPPKNASNTGNTWRLAGILGLTVPQVNVLFFKWRTAWPKPFLSQYAKRKSPLGKAKVAAALLEEVVRTNGACLGVE